MKYKYETESKNYEDFSSGRVLYNQSGATSFPVRLGSEIYQRCKEYLQEKGVQPPYTIYDPCCGGAFLLTILGFLHGSDFQQIIASDVEPEILNLAEDNLSLLTLEGMDRRMEQIRGYIDEFDKDSHREALESAANLRKVVAELGQSPETRCFRADALALEPGTVQADLVITDVPYGNLVDWTAVEGAGKGDGPDDTYDKDEALGSEGGTGAEGSEDPMHQFMESMLGVLKPASVIAVVADKKQKVNHDAYNRLKKFKIGKRQITILEPKTGALK